MTERPIRVAVVGHTNAGKTSLLRTLSRDVTFGEVSDRPGTTREVALCTLLIDGRPTMELFDTPGLEDSIGLFEAMEKRRVDHRADGLQMIQAMLASDDAASRFVQEAKALRQVLACDVSLYVVDARERVLAKYRDELRILGWCARPIVPVLNFVAAKESLTPEWRDQLARVNMHAVAEFDTVAMTADSELRLFEKIRSLLDAFRPALTALIAARIRDRESMINASARSVADMLVDAAAFSVVIDAGDPRAEADAAELLKSQVRAREGRCVASLLELHRFRPDDCLARPLPVERGTWAADVFDPALLATYGVEGGRGAAAGAMVGLTLDVMFGGLSLGAATALGATIGAALGAGRRPGMQLIERLRGRRELRCHEATLRLLASRQVALVHSLLHRGHADTRRLNVDQRADEPARPPEHLVRMLRPAFRRAEWSSLRRPGDMAPRPFDDRRDRLVARAADELRRLIEMSE